MTELTHRKYFVVNNVRIEMVKSPKGDHSYFFSIEIPEISQILVSPQFKIGRTEVKCIAMDNLAQEDRTYCTFHEECE